MSFPGVFVALVLFLLVAPKQFGELGRRIVEGVTPIISGGLTLAIMVAGIMIIIGRFK
jgi:hypothetical protein